MGKIPFWGATVGEFPHSTALRRLRPVLILSLLLSARLLGAGTAPLIDSLSATPATVSPGGTVTIALSAHDPDCVSGTCTTGCGQYIRADLTSWTATGGSVTSTTNGTSASPYSAAAQWLAPTVEGTYTISVYIADSGTFICGGRMSTTGTLPIQVTTVVGSPPVIASLVAEPIVVLPGQSSALTCVASDPDGGEPAISWLADAGVITPGTGGHATLAAPPEPATVTITCTATDVTGLTASATVPVVVTGALAERSFERWLYTPSRLAANGFGELYVVDPRAAAISVLDLSSGELIRRLRAPGVAAVAIDWNDDLLVGGEAGAEIWNRQGKRLFQFASPASDPITDVAVDPAAQRYAVLFRGSGRVVVFDSGGEELFAFGNTPATPGLLTSPLGLAATPSGGWVVADSAGGTIRLFDGAGSLVLSFGGLGGQAGEFVQLDDVAVDGAGRIYASDSFQDWVQIFDPDGSLREVVGTYGAGLGELHTASGIAVVEPFGWILVASQNGAAVQAFRTRLGAPAPPVPSANVAPAALAFAATAVGSQSAVQTVTVGNSGAGVVGVRAVTAGAGFSLTHDCPAVLDAGAACVVQVTFAPDRLGEFSEKLFVETSAAPQPLEVALTGPAFRAAELVLSPGALEFPEQPVGTASDPRQVTVINAGSLPLALAGASTTGDFGLASFCGAALAGGDSCAISVYFTPASAGNLLLGSLIVQPAAAPAEAVELAGSAVLLQVEASPRSLFFGVVALGRESAPRQIRLRNTGSALVSLGASDLVGAGQSDFVIASDGCSHQELEPGKDCAIDVAFAPQTVGVTTAQLRQRIDRIAPLLLNLAGGDDLIFADSFEGGDSRRWSLGSADFGPVTIGDVRYEKVTWTNSGVDDLEIGNVEWVGAAPGIFWLESDGCSGNLLPMLASCVLEIGFGPAEPLDYRAQIVFPLVGGPAWQTLGLNGMGVAP